MCTTLRLHIIRNAKTPPPKQKKKTQQMKAEVLNLVTASYIQVQGFIYASRKSNTEFETCHQLKFQVNTWSAFVTSLIFDAFRGKRTMYANSYLIQYLDFLARHGIESNSKPRGYSRLTRLPAGSGCAGIAGTPVRVVPVARAPRCYHSPPER